MQALIMTMHMPSPFGHMRLIFFPGNRRDIIRVNVHGYTWRGHDESLMEQRLRHKTRSTRHLLLKTCSRWRFHSNFIRKCIPLHPRCFIFHTLQLHCNRKLSAVYREAWFPSFWLAWVLICSNEDAVRFIYCSFNDEHFWPDHKMLWTPFTPLIRAVGLWSDVKTRFKRGRR